MDSVLWALDVMVRWIRLKIYQYEVTLAIYMLTPTEKFIFSMFQLCFLRYWLLSGNNGLLIVLDFLLLSLVTLSLTGAYIYLPDHAKSVYDHLYYYFVGERAFIASRIPLVSSGLEGGTQTLEDMYETARAAATTIMRRIA